MPSLDSDRDRYAAMIKVGCLVTTTTLSGAGVSMSLMSSRSGPA